MAATTKLLTSFATNATLAIALLPIKPIIILMARIIMDGKKQGVRLNVKSFAHVVNMFRREKKYNRTTKQSK